jgi:murein DD-endopeptidase MepM/ murein hydrolase activator NlpD
VDLGTGGDVVVAPADGFVRGADFSESMGHAVTLDHGKNAQGKYVISILIHLSERLVKRCSHYVELEDAHERCPIIKRGTPIGIVGNTGLLSGKWAHLHLGTYENSSRARKGWNHVDPAKYYIGGVIKCFDASGGYPEDGIGYTSPIKCK